MLLNTASQSIGAQMVTAADGSAFTGSVTVAVTIDSGTQATGSVGSGACTHEGNGYHSYRPAQAETNGAHIAFTFTGTGAIPATVQVFTRAGDAFTRLGAPAGASVSVDIAAVKTQTAAIETDTQDIQSRIPTALVGGRIDATVDGTGMEAGAVTAIQSGLATAAELAKVPKSDGTATWNATALAAIQSEANDALVAYDPPTKAELDAAVANVSVDEIQATALADLFNTDSGTTYGSAVAGSVVKEIADNAGGSSLTAADIADAVWDEATAGHAGAGSTGAALTAALADTNELQTDWANGGRLDLILDARASQASVDTIDDLLDTEIGALTTAVADLPTNAELATALGTADDAVLAQIALVKAKTDSLTFTVTGKVDANITHVIADPVQTNGATDTNWGGAP